MQNTPNTPSFLAPFRGFGYFIRHPSIWWLTFITTFIFSLLLIAIFVGVVVITWPHQVIGFWAHFWGILKSFGFGTLGILVGFIVLMPVLIMVALDKMIRKILLKEHGQVCDVSFFKSMYSGTIIFFKTLFWRIFWPIVGLFSALFLGPIGIFIGQLGLGHLAVIDAVDLTLALKGKDTQYRVNAYRENSSRIFFVGFSAAVLSMLLSFTIIGWFIWIPSVFAGVALWVNEWS